MTEIWKCRIHLVSYYGEVTIEQEAPGGTQETREHLVKQAEQLLEKVVSARRFIAPNQEEK